MNRARPGATDALPTVTIVGAGIAGCSAAAALSDTCEVVLLEREAHAAMHSTGRSAAYFAPAYGNAVVRELGGSPR